MDCNTKMVIALNLRYVLLLCQTFVIVIHCKCFFQFLECDEHTSENTCIGLSFHTDTSKLASNTDTFYVDGNGAININGIKKTTVLPKVVKGSKVSNFSLLVF